MSKARDLADLAKSANDRLDDVATSDGALSHRNLIINGGNIVSQRGDYTSATSITNNQYYLDRWKIAKSPSATLTHTDRKQRVDATSSTTGTLRCRQPIESDTISTFAGQTVTLSAKVKSNSTNARLNIYADGWLSGTGTPSHSGDGTDEILTYTVTLPTGTISVCTVDVGFDGALSADVSISSGDYFEMSEVQLEVGDTATPFEHRSYGDELARCQRYYSKTDAIQQTPDTNHIFNLIFPVNMRAAPSMTTTVVSGGGSGSATAHGLESAIYTPSGATSKQNIRWTADAEL